jgi:hypothetical protein
MSSSFHPISKCIFIQIKTDCSHFCNLCNCIEHFISPLIHFIFPILKIFWYYLRKIVWCIFWSLSYFPHKSPFCIKNRNFWRLWFIFFSISPHSLRMISSFLNDFRTNSNLVMTFRFCVFQIMTWVKLISSCFKILLHQVNIFRIISFICSRIFNY